EKQLPELDDEFAKDISEFDTLDAYKTDLREKLAKQYAEQADAEFENQLMDAVVNGMKVEVPACMINARIEELVQDFSARMEQQGLKLDDFIRYSGESPEKFHESFRPQAERQVKARLAMEAIAKAEQLGTTDEEIDAEYKKLAEAYKADADKLRLYFPRIELEADVACRKALDLIVSSGKVVSKKTEEPQEAASENAAQ
ncbi:MAG: trigger factor, partial [Oscillospiraceae bacterium]